MSCLSQHELVTVSLSDEQLDRALADPELRRELIKELVANAHFLLVKRFGEFLGDKFLIPISVATRLSGFSDKWIRRNMTLVSGAGLTTQIEFGKIVQAMEDRETKLKKS